MKKTIISMAAAALCALAISTQAFAEDVLTDRSVYAKDPQSIAQSLGSWELEGKTIFPDPDTITPLYEVDIYDYAKTGKFEVIPSMLVDADGTKTEGQHYISDAIDEDGNFVGRMWLVVGGEYTHISSYMSSSKNKVESVAFEPNAGRIKAVLSKQGINTDCKEIKLLFMPYIGYAYYIDNGTSEFLAAAGFAEVNGELFNSINGGIIEVGDELKAFADRRLAEYEEYKREVLDKLAPGELPPVGGGYDMPTFKVDNTPYLDGADNPPAPDSESSDGSKNDNPNTGADDSAQTAKRMAVLRVELSALAAAGIGITVINKKRKNKN